MIRRVLVAASLMCLATAPLAAQRSTAEAIIDRALGAFDAADIEGGAVMLRTLLASLPATERGARARALTWMGAVRWWTGQPDSANAAFRTAIETDPFVTADPTRLNPDVMEAYLAVRRTQPALGVRFTTDTIMHPDSGVWAMSVAVGRPGSVRLRLVGEGLDSAVATSMVDSTATLALRLTYADGSALRAGAYRLAVEELSGTTRIVSRELALTVERQRVDTTALLPLPTEFDFKPEQRRGGISGAGLLRGLMLAGGAAVLPMMIANGGVSGSTVQMGAAAIGITIGVASIIGANAGRPSVNIDENIQFNRNQRETTTTRNRDIAAANERLRRFAPLRLHVEATP